MASAPQPSARGGFADGNTLEAVRPEVRRLLLSVPAYAKLTPPEQRAIAQGMVKVAAYMANPEGLLTAPPAASGMALGRQPQPLAEGQADAIEATRQRLAQAPGQVGQTFQAGAVQQGVTAFGELVQKVDFPKFVGGLIQNVFQAIVTSSIQQMRAYGELISNVAKTVDEFAQDNISLNNARDWLAGKYPDALGVEIGSGSTGLADTGGASPPTQTATLTTKGDDPQADLTRISTDLKLPTPVTDISDPDSEAKLVTAARLEMARGRQQLLASMVMLGINRIVVTDGHIQAKVIFDIRADDRAARRASASMLDSQHDTSSSSASIGVGGWMSPISGGASTQSASDHMATVQSAVTDTSSSALEMKANLTGEVRVNFKSDYFPMDKMASPQMIAAIQGRSIPPEKPVAGA
jgi:hypothetical protein